MGVFEIKNSKGSQQALTIQSMLEYYDLTSQVIGIVADTTTSNSGRLHSAIRLLSVFGFEKSFFELYVQMLFL